ncbi:MAG: hypothetical protein IPH88_18305 [Bacteroidales bacterium]|nr:hypothetical protein [Bacteroidales bacterium]
MNEDIEYLSEAQILRLKAEQKLQRKLERSAMKENSHDPEILLHELQVHQIELEMQNEELRQSNEIAEAALKKYTMIYDLAPIGFFTIDGEGNIIDLNFTGAEMLGERRFILLNRNFKFFVAEGSRIDFSNFRIIFSFPAKRNSARLPLSQRNAQLKVYVEGIATGDEHQCLLSVIDIAHFAKLNSLERYLGL